MTAPTISDNLIAEVEAELPCTLKALERVPADKVDWQPHPKSMSLGKLAQHIAGAPGMIAEFLKLDRMDQSEFKDTPDEPVDVAALVPMMQQSAAKVKEVLSGMDDDALMQNWTFTAEGKELMTAPKVVVVRAFILSHWYHHRGQLTVYLRLLDIPVPSIYGPSADEDHFA